MGRLNWQNATATVLTGLIVIIYASFLKGTSWRLISTPRNAILVVLVLGIGAWVLYKRDFEAKRRARRDFVGIGTVVESFALLAAVIGLITGSKAALAVLVAGALALWLIATLRLAIIRRRWPSTSVGNAVSYPSSKAPGVVEGEVLERHDSAAAEVPRRATFTAPDRAGPDRAGPD